MGSRKRKDLEAYMPDRPDEPLVPVQAKIPVSLRSQINKRLHERKFTMKELITAAIKKFLDDNPPTK